MSLAKNIKTLRENDYKSQEKIAEYMNVSRQTISKWENGTSEPAVNDLIRMAKYFNVTLDDLILGDIEPLPLRYRINPSQLRMHGNKVMVADEETDEIENIFFPSVKPEDFTAYQAFMTAYDINVKIDKTGDKSYIGEMMDLYQEAFDDGLVEAGANILKIVARALMNGKALAPERPLPYQDRLECYIKALEDAGHPAGGFYRAFVLIYGLRITGKTEDEDLDDGLTLMYSLTNEGNELAVEYVEYIESTEQES